MPPLPARILAATPIVLTLSCLLLAAWTGLTARSDAIDRATRDMTHLADTLEHQLASDLALFDLILREAAHPSHAATHMRVPDHPLLARHMSFLNRLNETGDVIADSRANPIKPANFSGRDYFQAHLRDPSETLAIGRPFGSGPNQRPAIPLSRRLNAPDGSFAGVMVAGVRLSWPRDRLEQSMTDPHLSLTLHREDGTILTRIPFDPDATGRNAATSPDDPSSGARPSDALRLSRRIGASGLVLDLTMECASILARERAWWVWPLTLTVPPCCCVLGLTLLTHRLRRRGARIEAGARHANDERLNLLATMSHELRTPLTGIIGQAELLRAEGGFTPRQAMRLERLTEAGALMRLIIDRVIDVTRPDERITHPILAPCDLDLLARTCRSRIEDGAWAKGLCLTSHVAPAVPRHAMLDRGLLEQILGNLLANAVKYTAEGTIALRLAQEGAWLRFEVADTGPGIGRHERHRLFRAYDRLGMRESRIEGTGLGLAITERLVKAMGGRIGHHDNPGGGSVFRVDIPAILPPAPPPEAAAPSEAVSPPGPPMRPLRVLLADDLEVTRAVTADFLRGAGHTVVEAPDGETATRLAGEEDFDVIMTDMRMPGRDGLETTRRIRALPGRRGHVPVVLVTADLAARDLETSGGTGIDLCLMKPFTRAELLATAAAAARMARPGMVSPTLPVLDEDILADLHLSMGADAVEAHFRSAARRIEDFLTLLDDTHASVGASGGAAIGDAAHDLIGVTGLLGLRALSACLRQFDIQADHDAIPALRGIASEALLALRRRQEPAAVD